MWIGPLCSPVKRLVEEEESSEGAMMKKKRRRKTQKLPNLGEQWGEEKGDPITREPLPLLTTESSPVTE